MGRITSSGRAAVPDVGQGRRGAGGHIGYLLRQAHAAHRARMDRALAIHGVTPPQFSAMVMLAAYPGASGAELARMAMLTPQTMNVIVSNLERDGVIVRHAHPEHGRIQINELTLHGKALLAQCKRAVKHVEDALLQGLTPEQEQTVRQWLVSAAYEASDPSKE